MVDRGVGRKAKPTPKLNDEQSKSVPSTQQAAARTATQQETGNPAVPSRLEKAISELQGLNELLLSTDLDPRVLADFRDAVNRVRTAAWAAQQYAARKETDEGLSSVLTFLAVERVRATYQLCQAISDDLKRTDIAVPAGSLIQLFEVMSALTEQLKGIVNKLG
jgi:hypothetical protein